MKAIMKVQKEKEGFELRDVPVPQAGSGDVLIKVKAVAICGSDLKFYKWSPWCDNMVRSLPFIPGHECCGEVTEVGSGVKGIKKGDKVAAETHVPCGECWQCLHGRPHTCEKMELFGHAINGGFAEYAIVPQSAARKIPESISFEHGSLLEPMGIPYRAAQAGRVEDDTVVVIGCGPIGQFAIAFSKILGASLVVGVDVNEKRLNIAQKMGATHLVNPQKENLVENIKNLTRDYGGGAGAVIDASGNAKAVKQAFSYLRVGGRFIIIGQTDAPLTVSPSKDIVVKESKIIGLFGREIWGTWERTEELLSSHQINPDPVITHKFSLDEFEKAFKVAFSGQGCKILFIP